MDFNLDEIKRTIGILKPNNQLYEIRILKKTPKKITISGYFKGTENLEQAFKTVSLDGANVFISLQTVNAACYGRVQRECFRQTDVTTTDVDITNYEWFFIDLDPVRPSEVSSTNEELTASKNKAGVVYRYLKEKGFSEPIVALSGNGIHLLYCISLQNNKENCELVKSCLAALDFLFSDDVVGIDTVVANPGRISKLYGTMAKKGLNLEDRPHRMSKILRVPEKIQQTPKDKLQSLAAEYQPEIERQSMGSYNGGNDFDIEQWMSDHGLRVHSIKNWKDATKYVLEECPFDSNHKAPDSTIIKMRSGAIAFKCLHNSCSGRTWQDVRRMYEPDAYDNSQREWENDRRIELGWREHYAYNRNRQDLQPQIEETPENPKWETIEQILKKPVEKRVTIKTGIDELDRSIGGGLAKGEISVISGLRASAKSTMLTQWCLNAVDMEYNVLVYSGELTDHRFANWLLVQAAGRKYVEISSTNDNVSSVKDPAIKLKIARWIGEHLLLYNNKFGNKFASIKNDIESKILEHKADLIILDNLAILDLEKYSQKSWGDNQFVAQTEFIKDLKDMAIRYNCHICFVAHPRKSDTFLRLETIAGTGNIPNLVDTAFIVHRINQFFKTSYKQYFLMDVPADLLLATNLIEIAKDRECGTQDKFVPLWYEKGSKRLKNYESEDRKYGWESLI